MKRIGAGLSILLVFLLVEVGAVFSQSNVPGGGWWTGEQVQNIGARTANLQAIAYDISETLHTSYPATATVKPGAAFTFLPPHFQGMPDGYQGAVVVGSNQPIKAIVNVTNRPTTIFEVPVGVDGGEAAAQYQGVDESRVDDTLYFPLVKAGHYGKTTTFYIQNVGRSSTNLNALFNMRDGVTHTLTLPSISPNQMAVLSLYDVPTFDDSQDQNSAGRVGGLIVTANQPLAGVVMEHFTIENPATVLQATRGFTERDFDTRAYAPVIKHNRYGRFTGIQVQNVTAQPISVTVTYRGTAGACLGETMVDFQAGILPYKSHTFVQYEDRTTLPGDCTASATIEGSGEIVAIVNESYRSDSIPATGQVAVTSSAIPDRLATTKVSMPLFKDDRYNKRTGLQIQNVSQTEEAHIVATFSCSGGAEFVAVSANLPIRAGSGLLFYKPSNQGHLFVDANVFKPNVNCAVTVVSSDQRVVAIANESVIPPDQGGTLEQDNNNYEGINLQP